MTLARIFTSLLLASTVSGFMIPNSPPTGFVRNNADRPLFSTMVVETEADARMLLSRAKQCAYGDSCSVEEAEFLLNEMLHTQSGCVTGTLVGHDLCEEQDVAADIVAHLRQKVKNKSVATTGSDSVVPKLMADLSLVAMALIVAAFCTTLDMGQRHGTTPFTMQEWWWALRDGYLPSMVEHYFRNGGL